MSQKSTVLLAFTGVFVAGAIAGGIVSLRVEREREAVGTTGTTGAVATRPAPTATDSTSIPPYLLRSLTNQLALTAEQKEKIQPILSKAGEKIANLSRDNRVATNALLKEMDQEVSAFLTEEQRVKLTKLEADREKQITDRNRQPGDRSPNRRGGPPSPNDPFHNGNNPGGPPGQGQPGPRSGSGRRGGQANGPATPTSAAPAAADTPPAE